MFSNCQKLESAVFPDTVRSLGNLCLSECTALENVTLPAHISELPNNLFAGCVSLKTVKLPQTLHAIGMRSFSGCTALEQITIPGGVTMIGRGAFSSCKSLTALTLPASLTAVPDELCSGCAALTKISIPARVTSIGYNAFSGTNPETVTLPDALTKIGNGAFAGTPLKEITLPAQLTVLGSGVFSSCLNLTGVSIPDSVEKFSLTAFAGCPEIKTIRLPSNITALEDSYGNTGIEYEAQAGSVTAQTAARLNITLKLVEPAVTTTVVTTTAGTDVTTGTVTTPAYIIDRENGLKYEQIGALLYVAGCDTEAKDITVPGEFDGKQIGGLRNCPFAGCRAEKITLPDSLTYFSGGEFRNAENLKEISFSESLTYIPDCCFEGCAALTKLPTENITSISTAAFRGCSALDLGEWTKATYISESAFENCTSLSSFTASEELRYVSQSAFRGCSSLKTVKLPESLDYIYDYAFEGCSALEAFTFPERCTSIGQAAFSGCTALKAVVLPAQLNYMKEGAFAGCTSLKSAELPEQLTSVYTRTFADCTALETVTMRSRQSVALSNEAFINCPNLKTIEYSTDYFSFNSYSVGYMRDAAGVYTKNETPVCFKGIFCYNFCEPLSAGVISFIPTNLTYHVIPETDTVCIDYIELPEQRSSNTCYIPPTIEGKPVAVLGNGAPCVSADTAGYVYIPESIEEIGDYAFLNCGRIEGISYYTDKCGVKKVGQQAFYGTAYQEKTRASGGCISIGSLLYRCFAETETFEVSEFYIAISADAFAHNRTCQEIILPDSITEIGDGAFYDCRALKTVVIPDSVTKLGSGVFVNCKALESVTLGSGLTDVGSDLFAGCDALKEIPAVKP